jgi:SAM-dependent methyltransferase
MTFRSCWCIWGDKTAKKKVGFLRFLSNEFSNVPRGTLSIKVNTKQQHIPVKVKDFLVSDEEFSLVPNAQYGFLETHPQPRPEALSNYYESEEYISHTDSTKGLLAFLYQRVKGYSLRKKVRLIESMNSAKKGSLLDIGAGTGEFLKVAREKGWDITGVEPSEKARNFASSKNIELCESMDELNGKKFDAVTLWHVLEHVPDLKNTIQKIESLVKKDGSLVIAVPNFNSFDAKYYKEFWAAYDVPRHLWHFSQDSMNRIFSSELKLEKTKPLIFDSFYVSLLSEKYKTGNKFSPKAIVVGLKSNLLAWRSREYSSLIYCFKKIN